MSKLEKIFLFIIIVFVLIFVSILIAFSTKEKYDVSHFHEVKVSDVLDMFEDNNTHVLYVGYEDCEMCLMVNPSLEKAQVKYNYMTSYLDLASIDFESEDWKKLKDLLNMDVEQTLSEDGSGQVVVDTFGNFLDEYGLVPTVIVIEDGKQKGGFIGGFEEENILGWIEYILTK